MDGHHHRNNNHPGPSVRPKVPKMRGPERDYRRPNNNDKLVNQRTVSVSGDRGKKHLAALHQSFVHPIDHFRFLPLPTFQNSEFQSRLPADDIIARIIDFESNLHIILRLPYHRFWSTMIFDSNVNMGLRSYINNAPRFYMAPVNLDENLNYAANSIHKSVFKVYCRLSTCTEDPKNCMSPDYYGKMILEKKIFDIPLLMDLCAIYGNIYPATNQKLTSMVETVLNCHPDLIKNLESSVSLGKDKLTKIISELGLTGGGERVVVDSQHTTLISTLTWSHIFGIIEQIVGTVVPISFLISISPTAARSYRSARFDASLVDFYENLFPKLKDELTSRFAKDAKAKKASETIIRFLTISRCCLVKAFRNMIKFDSLDNLLDDRISLDEKTVLIDEYLDMISIATSSSCFSKDYFTKYSFDSDICLLMEKADLTGFRSVDPSRIDYLFNVIASNQGNSTIKSSSTSFSSSKTTTIKPSYNSSDNIKHANSSANNINGFNPNLLAKLKYSEATQTRNGSQRTTINRIKLIQID
ncbi:activating signal cointegrator 1 complex subunit 2-like [Panonychus citri]|uniref:activating signal cointegrator 1 complex subunit 2-like n=1 Tax=Panonychus citri TaxID=50023 RepID=UPI00230726B3|nr:activating signal cointegrator 1 complex subunit 2-like [Panonychus citri]